uniref:DUF4269 domain-containing protein n=1 Tax=Roseihalotalea indica TaxID=2867963 RepID=A0AA49JKD3_9BACT|nr:DUF4269 domain-containing protein [Tunicatimonas sp. TK19036]
MDFTNPDYLKTGNERQQQAYHAINQLAVFATLAPYNPVLTGTIPIGIDIPGSDLDIICEVYQPDAFIQDVKARFGYLPGFSVRQTVVQELPTVIINFCYQGWPFELFGQPLPATRQVAYRHMMIEHRILQLASPDFRLVIRQLKQAGMKTEPVFAHLLHLPNSPYDALLALAPFSDEQLFQLLSKNGYTA